MQMTSFSIDDILGVGSASRLELEAGNRKLPPPPPPEEFCLHATILRDEGEVVYEEDGDSAKDLTKKIRAEIRNRVRRSVLRFQQMDQMLSEHETIHFLSTNNCDKRGNTALRPYVSADICKNSFTRTWVLVGISRFRMIETIDTLERCSLGFS